MNDDFVKRFAQLAPKPMNRDAVLFQAGVHAGRNAKPWQWLSAILGVLCITLIASHLWPKVTKEVHEAPKIETPLTAPLPDSEPRELSPSSYLALMQDLGNTTRQQSSTTTETQAASHPPLRVRSTFSDGNF